MRGRGIVATGCVLMGLGSAGTPLSGQDVDALARVFEIEFAQAWEARDVAALVDLWTEDGDWSSVVGSRRVVRGHAALRQIWETGLNGRTRPEELAIDVDVDHVRLLGDHTAVVDVVMTFAPHASTAAREAFVMVMERTGDRWRIASARAVRLS